MDINKALLQWFINILIKRLLLVVFKVRIFQANNYRKNFTNQLLEILRKEMYTYLLLTISEVQM